MKVLYVGGIYPVEYSLFKEGENNPKLSVLFANNGACMPDAFNACGPRVVVSRSDIEKVKQEFRPDLTLFRDWSPTQTLIHDEEVLWAQEILATGDSRNCSEENTIHPKYKRVAYQSKPRAEKSGGMWLPYCVSRFGSWTPKERNIQVMVATALAPETAGVLKRRSLDILAKPIVEWNPSVLAAFNGYHGGLETIQYIRQCLRPSFSPLEATENISCAKIYLSPSAIWYDPGCVSYKTVEAMACKALVITTPSDGVEDVFGPDGKYLLYSSSPQETLDKVRHYLEHDAEREEIAERAYEFVHDTYGWEKNLTRVKEDLDVLMGKAGE